MFLNSLFTTIIDKSINYIFYNSIIVDIINYILTTTIITIISGISFYMYRGVKRGLKILVPAANIGVGLSQNYLNYLQIQEMRRNGNNINPDKDVPKNKSVDQKPSPKS
jgi:hypothetical protein